MKFNTPVRTAEERQSHKEKLNEIFARVGQKGKLDRRGIQKLHEERVDVAELLIELIQDELAVVDATPFLVDKRPAGFTDKHIFQEMTGALSVVSRAYGSKPLSQRMVATEYSFATSMKELAVEIPLEEIAAGRITAAQVVEAMAFTINRYKVALVLDAIDTAITAVADRSGVSGYNLRYAGFTQDNYQKAVDGLRDNGESPTILGRHLAVYPELRGFAGWGSEQKGDFLLRGQVGTFLGAPVVTLIDKYSKLTGGHNISADRVWISSGGQKGGWLVEKDVTFLNWALVDERTATFSTGIRLEDGVFIHDKYKYRVLSRS